MMPERTPTLPLSLRAAPVGVLALALTLIAAAPLPPSLLSGLVWRNIGPLRGGRISAVSGAIGEPGTFYAGTPAGGLWKTTSAGEVWYPVFDAIPGISSIGAVAVAPSNLNIVYVGSGDEQSGTDGNGVYKSTDAGRTWQHLGLDATKSITSLTVDPADANILVVGAIGSFIAKSDARGAYRSTDGGATWTKTLYVSDSEGVRAFGRAHDRPEVIFAATSRNYQSPPPASGVYPPFDPAKRPPPSGAFYKSTDAGVTWKKLAGATVPTFRGRVSMAVAANTNAQRVFIITNDGLFRSDDGGATWRRMARDDRRIRNGQGGYNCGVFVDPRNPDIVYTFNTASYKSTDGGATFTGFRGAPGGDDAQAGWIDPTDGRRMIFGYDQGAIVSLNGGATWSSWYNQSTEQVYRIAADNSFPYWVYATQQDAGAVRVRSRGNFGEITPLDWSPVDAWEWGTIAPDPLDVNTVYSSGFGLRKVSFPSDQWISVSPLSDPSLKLRTSLMEPIVWTPWDQKELLAGYQFVMSTTDGGLHWKTISPDLTVRAGVASADSADAATSSSRASIESIAPSTVAKGTIWVGTDNGLIKLTRDGGRTWTDVTIPNIPYPMGADIIGLEASHTNAGGAYAAVLSRLNADTPHLYRTRDYGKTWTLITQGLPVTQPGGGVANVIREDPKRAGLLFAGTTTGMYVSFDDGEGWQPLQLNLPVTMINDIIVKGNDLIVGTYGRGIWILDDYAVLRQMTPEIAKEPVHLFAPDSAVRVRRNVGFNTPNPPEVPHSLNPPDGVILYYWLASAPAGEVTIDVTDANGAPVRHLSSIAAPPVKEAARPPHPGFWIAPPAALPTAAGTNRAAWDMRYDAPSAFTHEFEINANPGFTPAAPLGVLAPPGTYTITLTVDGKRYAQRATVVVDPRSRVTASELRAQSALLFDIQTGMSIAWKGYQQVDSMRAALPKAPAGDSTSELAKALASFSAALDSIGGDAESVGPPGPGLDDGSLPVDFADANGRFAMQLVGMDNADQAPTEPMLRGYVAVCLDLSSTAARWRALNATAVPALNAVLVKNGMKPLSAAAGVAVPKC
jgi:photosystem II stability/assembly factor-like uncharacterized protein